MTFSIGSSNFGDWQDITNLIKTQGTGPTSILYKDFQALKTAIPSLDAIDFDDENSFDSATTISFGVMLGQLELSRCAGCIRRQQLLDERYTDQQSGAWHRGRRAPAGLCGRRGK